MCILYRRPVLQFAIYPVHSAHICINSVHSESLETTIGTAHPRTKAHHQPMQTRAHIRVRFSKIIKKIYSVFQRTCITKSAHMMMLCASQIKKEKNKRATRYFSMHKSIQIRRLLWPNRIIFVFILVSIQSVDEQDGRMHQH